ncbi:non-hydrolyzing UDP-N-acetylglucosamine 2-epimerase [Natrinema hispanicum]|uniref:UDP-N-acetylglucosamine 2-epimerase (Non-hydrolysing) n=1 Tax=Natrinema hispanicum TaxID=392421 RepID=A0A1I0J1U5_9EURY|nr:UDP-N-acetylglucosamine 2-epimerase (non-hydrolyzing) [Natrinema hispanicum]SDD47995.1 UDP-N-acetylglucosamine 2-epimerase (non-hydrolysing) [Natrinema hispanicum]SEU03740.1 UDP-N-acetylglucosamine 2-epimerase (non-hydrolysing) [Natrinema hispanicum]
MNVLSVVGARPQFVKAAAVSQQLRDTHDELLVHTGQHYDPELSEVFFEELALPEPAFHLGVGSDSHATQTAEMMLELERIIDDESPDVVLVYGDTNSTLAAALVAAKSSTQLAHVEAGLRSYDWSMPEEVNRRLTDHCSDILFAPGQHAKETLAQEGISENVFVSGDVMYDTLIQISDRLHGTETELDVPDEYVLATVHRAKNTDDRDRLESIIDAFSQLHVPVVFPAHPRTVTALQEYGLWDRATEAARVIDPVTYGQFITLVEDAVCVATDSGGVQKEAFYLDTPCVTLRETTEWIETVDAGWNTLVGAETSEIVDAVRAAVDPPAKPELYGNGNAAARIVEQLERSVR